MMPVLRFFFFFFVRPGERGAEEAAEAGVVFDDGFVDEADAAVFADEFF